MPEQSMTEQPTIGWIGLGRMGVPMARNLLAAGFPVAVYNRTPGKADAMVEFGATAAADIASLAGQSDVVISMIADDAALAAVAEGPDGILANLHAGATYIDMSTVSPAASATVAAAAEAAGITYLRAPVSGSTALAEKALLTVLASGPQDAFDACLDIFKALSQKQFHLGDGEAARYVKLSINMMLGISAAMISEALCLSAGSGLDRARFMEVVMGSVLASPLLGYKTDAIVNRDFTPAFSVSQLIKDTDLALDAARAADIPLPVTALVRQNLGALKATGRGDRDFIAYVELMDEMAGKETPATE